MKAKEFCSYTRTYSELEGLQTAHTVLYTAAALPQGVVMELCCKQSGQVRRSAVLCPGIRFARAMELLRYLSENSVGLDAWQAVLEDAGQPYTELAESQLECISPGNAGKSSDFCGNYQF